MRKIINLLTIIFLLLLIASIVLALYFYFQYLILEANPAVANRYNSNQVEQALSQFMVLPDEQPLISTVIDKNELQDKNFFAHAENGDQILIYKSARKAILWRPSTSKVIEIAPLIIDEKDLKSELEISGFSDQEIKSPADADEATTSATEGETTGEP